MPARSRSEGFDLAVVALSARALARSAKRAGLRALAIDLFADADTQEHAARAVRAPAGGRGLGFSGPGLLAALRQHAPKGLPVVLGAGFEHAPRLMREIARRNPVLGAPPEAVAALKDPTAFATLLSALDIAHPDIVLDGPAAALHLSPVGRGRRGAPGEGEQPDPESLVPPHPLGFASRPLPTGERSAAALDGADGVWLSKRAGASGGAHIRPADRAVAGRRRYLQRRVDGRAVSALFLADGCSASVLGFSEQWPDPTPHAPFRYGGAVGPVALAPDLGREVADALDRVVAATGLVGLASADVIVPPGDEGFRLLEINPRPGATLDLFDRDPWPSLLTLHRDACEGRLPGPLPPLAAVHGVAVLHALAPVVPTRIARPLWTADWPSCDDVVPVGAPVCTVVASGASPSAVRARLDERRAALLDSLRAAVAPAPTNRTKAPA